jgi:protein phosphatase methylesterase 1
MSDLQRKWAKAKFQAMADVNENESWGGRAMNEHEEAETGHLPELPEIIDDDSSSASSVSSTGPIVPSPSRSLFARPQG